LEVITPFNGFVKPATGPYVTSLGKTSIAVTLRPFLGLKPVYPMKTSTAYPVTVKTIQTHRNPEKNKAMTCGGGGHELEHGTVGGKRGSGGDERERGRVKRGGCG
jgi:hypothetical protein